MKRRAFIRLLRGAAALRNACPHSHPCSRSSQRFQPEHFSVYLHARAGDGYSHATARAGPPRPAFPAFLAGAGQRYHFSPPVQWGDGFTFITVAKTCAAS